MLVANALKAPAGTPSGANHQGKLMDRLKTVLLLNTMKRLKGIEVPDRLRRPVVAKLLAVLAVERALPKAEPSKVQRLEDLWVGLRAELDAALLEEFQPKTTEPALTEEEFSALMALVGEDEEMKRARAELKAAMISEQFGQVFGDLLAELGEDQLGELVQDLGTGLGRELETT